MITTTTFLIDPAWVTGVGVGVGVAGGVGAGELDEFFTPPHPSVKARNRAAKKNKNALFKGISHLSDVFESTHLSLVGCGFNSFVTNLLLHLNPFGLRPHRHARDCLRILRTKHGAGINLRLAIVAGGSLPPEADETGVGSPDCFLHLSKKNG
jgi:hypothetical protein